MPRRGRLRAAEIKMRQRARVTAQKERDGSAHNLAQSVYLEAVEWKGQGGPPAMAGVTVAARLLAPAVCVEKGADLTEQNATAIAAFLVSEFLRSAATLDLAAVAAYARDNGIPGATL